MFFEHLQANFENGCTLQASFLFVLVPTRRALSSFSRAVGVQVRFLVVLIHISLATRDV